VTDLSERAMQLRCLATCRNSSDGFNLGCELREHMAGYIQEHYPQAFPTTRLAGRVEGREGAHEAELPKVPKASAARATPAEQK